MRIFFNDKRTTFIYLYIQEMVSINRFNYRLILFCLIFGVIFYDFIQQQTGFSYIDEFITLFLVIYLCKSRKERSVKELYAFVAIVLFYLLHSFIFPHNVVPAIITDFLIQIKPFLAFYVIWLIPFKFTDRDKQRMCKACIWLALLILPIGVLSPGGGQLMLMFGGHSRYATMAIALGITYIYFSRRRKKDLYIALIIFSIGLLSLRSKMFGFYTAYIGIIFLWKKIPRRKYILSPKTIILFSIIILGVLYVAREKILFYFVVGTEGENMFARPLLYVKAIEILKDYPLFGTGFGSYATYASALYYSPLYFTYDLYLSPEIGNGLFISDTYFPVFAQFGYIGFILFILFWVKRYKTAKRNFLNTGDMLSFKMVILIIVFFFIESIADSTFTHNRGMYMMMLLALFLKNNNNENKSVTYCK